jgi:hypothetical protein
MLAAVDAVIPPWVYSAAVFGFPFAAPIVASRRGCLSIARWLILSVSCFLSGGFAALAYWGMHFDDFRLNPRFPTGLATVAVLGMIGGFVGGFGCMVAAGVHPKPKTA